VAGTPLDARAADAAATAFLRIGGAAVVQAIVERFYDLMDSDPAYAELRAMHAPDLAPMRASLAGFLTAWLGGPRDWFAGRSACIMSLHAPLPIRDATAAQWAHAMARAIRDSDVADRHVAGAVSLLLARIAMQMAHRTPG
jgi:hemoglobin